MTVSYVTFFIEDGDCKSIKGDSMKEALANTERVRTQRRHGAKITHIIMAFEDTDMVGELGVDSIVDGKTPGGDDYTWKKRRI